MLAQSHIIVHAQCILHVGVCFVVLLTHACEIPYFTPTDSALLEFSGTPRVKYPLSWTELRWN